MSMKALTWFNQLPKSCFKSAQEKLLLLEICKRQWEDGRSCEPFALQLMSDAFINSRITFRALLKSLEEKGLISVQRHQGRKHSYFVTFKVFPSPEKTGYKNAPSSKEPNETGYKTIQGTGYKSIPTTGSKNIPSSCQTGYKTIPLNINTSINRNKRDINTLVSESVSAPVNPIPEIPNPNLEQGDKLYPTSKKPDLDVKAIVEIFNKTCADLPHVQKLTKTRQSAVIARWKELKQERPEADPTTFFADFFKSIHASNFLNNRYGTNQNSWKTDFDWIFRPTRFWQILEGRFDNNTQKQFQRQSAPFANQPAKKNPTVFPSDYYECDDSYQIDENGRMTFNNRSLHHE